MHSDIIPNCGPLEIIATLKEGTLGSLYIAQPSTRVSSSSSSLRPHFLIKALQKSEVLSSGKLKRVITEYSVFKSLHKDSHPSLQTAIAAFQTPRLLVYVVPYFKQGSLADALRGLPLQRIGQEEIIKSLAVQLVAGLEFLHHVKHFIHRDVKPENILVCDDGRVCLADYDLCLSQSGQKQFTPHIEEMVAVSSSISAGSSELNNTSLSPPLEVAVRPGLFQRSHSAGSNTSITSSNRSHGARTETPPFDYCAEPVANTSQGSVPSNCVQPSPPPAPHIMSSLYRVPQTGGHRRQTSFVGTPEYMSPDVILDERPTEAMDCWAIGVLLYECMYGATPFEGNSERDTLDRIVRCKKIPFPLHPSISPQLKDLITCLLNRSDKSKRITTCEAIKNHKWFKQEDFTHLHDGAALKALLHDSGSRNFAPGLDMEASFLHPDDEAQRKKEGQQSTVSQMIEYSDEVVSTSSAANSPSQGSLAWRRERTNSPSPILRELEKALKYNKISCYAPTDPSDPFVFFRALVPVSPDPAKEGIVDELFSSNVDQYEGVSSEAIKKSAAKEGMGSEGTSAAGGGNPPARCWCIADGMKRLFHRR